MSRGGALRRAGSKPSCAAHSHARLRSLSPAQSLLHPPISSTRALAARFEICSSGLPGLAWRCTVSRTQLSVSSASRCIHLLRACWSRSACSISGSMSCLAHLEVARATGPRLQPWQTRHMSTRYQLAAHCHHQLTGGQLPPGFTPHARHSSSTTTSSSSRAVRPWGSGPTPPRRRSI